MRFEARARTICQKAKNLVRRYNPVTCLLLCGSNDTTVLNRRYRTISPRFTDSFDLANYLIDLILQGRKELIALYPNTKFMFGGILGVALNVYNQLPGTSPLQVIIDDMITQVNCYLRLLNQLVLASQPRLTSKVHCWRRGVRKNYYHLLHDGLHLGALVRDTWVREILMFHHRNSASLCLVDQTSAPVSEHS